VGRRRPSGLGVPEDSAAETFNTPWGKTTLVRLEAPGAIVGSVLFAILVALAQRSGLTRWILERLNGQAETQGFSSLGCPSRLATSPMCSQMHRIA